jgi:hypothetical protein
MWNGKDYSVISPKLTAHFRRNPFYLLTYLRHLNERSLKEFTIDEILEFNQKCTGKSIHVEKVKYLSYIFTLGNPESSAIVGPQDYLLSANHFMVNLIERVVCQSIVEFTALSNDRDVKIQNAKRDNHVQMLRTTTERNSDEINYFGHAVQLGLDLKELQFLFVGMRFAFQEEKYVEKGVEFTNSTDSQFKAFSEVLPSGDKLICHETLRYLIKLHISMQDTKMRKRTVTRLGLDHEKNQRSSLKLFSLLNSCLVEDRIYSNENYIPFSKKEQEPINISHDLFNQFLGLFKLDIAYNELLESVSAKEDTRVFWDVQDVPTNPSNNLDNQLTED